ncbi:ribonuclease J [Trueperella bonasi]|uniref:Ribonuclease J n=1 Tax=Trueperella bonasi TaxID=312286 RepID=A0ABT9NHY1_9ACTO|nr:ribonuclease J [Trueperella bonasi]MDP9806980.1 ribonuclease J [Trueperella bonasi]
MTESNLPPSIDNGTLRIVPLGGIEEVGRNMTVFEIDGRILIVDCGVLFPEVIQPGVDLILPDFDYLQGKFHQIDGIVLTHGHEDHIGAVPYLLRERKDIPLIGSKLTIALVEAKLEEHKIKPYSLVVEEGDVEKIGNFECEFIAVNHSIPDALAVAIHTNAGTVLHTGDFKMDQLPLDGRVTDLRGMGRVADDGVDLLLIDSTNSEVPGFVPSEVTIAPALDEAMDQARGKVIVASFASHVHRVQLVIDAAVKHDRKVCFVGRSMVRNMGIAHELGYLSIPEGTLVELGQAANLPDEDIVYMSTGSQGEPMAAISRIANGNHRSITVGPNDTVVFASSLIPGNEESVNRLINQLTKLGTKVIHSGNAHVHVSGHAFSGEILVLYNVVEPEYVMPVHGEARHLVANGKLAVSTGVPTENVLLTRNGSVIDMVDGVPSVVGEVPVGYVYVDGSSVGEITEEELTDRITLGEEGFIAIFAVVDTEGRKVLSGPHIQARGMAEDDAVFDDIMPDVRKALDEAVSNPKSTTHQMQQAMRRVIGRWVSRKLRRKPMIIPTVVEGS